MSRVSTSAANTQEDSVFLKFLATLLGLFRAEEQDWT